MNKEIFYLTPEQEKLFNKLKRTYRECEKAGIFFVNNYGELYGYNKKYICDYSDMRHETTADNEVTTNELNGNPGESFRIANEWCDDTHVFGLTKKGWELYNK